MGKKFRPDKPQASAPSSTANVLSSNVHVPAANLELFPDHARLLGLIVAEASNIEQLFVTLLAMTLQTEVDVVFAMIYAFASGRARLAAMQAAFERLIPDKAERKHIDDAFTDARKLLEKRNDYAHLHYDFEGDRVFLVTMKHVGTGKPAGRELPVAELEQCFNRMKELSAFVALLLLAVRLRPPVTVQAPPAQPQNPPG